MFFLFSDPRIRQEDALTMSQKIRELDLVSNCLFIPSLTALFVALSWAGTKYPWSDGKVIGLFIVFAVLLAAFVFNQYRRGDSAALPFRILKNRSVIAGFIFTTCTNSMTNVLEWYLPTYYQVVRSKVRFRDQFAITKNALTMQLLPDPKRERLSDDPDPRWNDAWAPSSGNRHHHVRLLSPLHDLRLRLHANCRGLDDNVRSTHIASPDHPLFRIRRLQWRYRLPRLPSGSSDNAECSRYQPWHRRHLVRTEYGSGSVYRCCAGYIHESVIVNFGGCRTRFDTCVY